MAVTSGADWVGKNLRTKGVLQMLKLSRVNSFRSNWDDLYTLLHQRLTENA